MTLRMTELTLTALDGQNPLGLFAALGVLAAITETEPSARLRWRYAGGWCPVLTSECPDVESLVRDLDADRQGCIGNAALALNYEDKRDLKPPPGQFRTLLLELLENSSPRQRRDVDWASAFATDVAVDNKGNTKPTAFHFTAGQQQFLQMTGELVTRVTASDLAAALVGPWAYDSPLPVLGWDATASRDYALRASDPSTDKKLGVPGADWLALRGLSFFPVVPRGIRVVTTGCSGGWKDGQFCWPVWTVALTAPVVRSVLGLGTEAMSREERRARGIGAVFCSAIKRSDQGGYGSFEPPVHC